jgi:hypothetical protein
MQEACQWENWPKKAHRLGRAAAIAAEIPQEMPPWIGRTAPPDMLTPPLRVNLSGQSDPDGEFAGEAKYRVSRSSQARSAGTDLALEHVCRFQIQASGLDV